MDKKSGLGLVRLAQPADRTENTETLAYRSNYGPTICNFFSIDD